MELDGTMNGPKHALNLHSEHQGASTSFRMQAVTLRARALKLVLAVLHPQAMTLAMIRIPVRRVLALSSLLLSAVQLSPQRFQRVFSQMHHLVRQPRRRTFSLELSVQRGMFPPCVHRGFKSHSSATVPVEIART